MWFVLLTACAPDEPAMVTDLREAAPAVIAHRGGDDLAPESTLPAFQAAWSAGAHVLEIDVRRSTDGVYFVLHDDTVDRTTDGTGIADEMSWKELRALDAGYHWSRDGGASTPMRGSGIQIPRLEELFEQLPDQARINIDIKSRHPDAPAEVAAIVIDHGAEDRVCVGSFDAAVSLAFQALLPDSCTYYSEAAARWLILGDLLPVASTSAPWFHILEVPEEQAGIQIVTRGFVRRAHRRGQLVWVWTVNDADRMAALIDIGVDGFITDEVMVALDATQ